MSRISRTLRSHLHFFVIMTILIVLMTYPTIRYVLDTDVFWLPTTVQDVWTKIWNVWYGKLLVSGQADYWYTDLMFYPQGVSLAYHTLVIPHMLVAGILELFLPASNAYNLTYLLIIFASAGAAYTYLLYLFRHSWISLFGAVVFGCSQYVIQRPSQPDVSLIALLPLALYFFHRAAIEKRARFAVLAGALTGLQVFIGWYTYFCIVIALGLYIIYFALARWRQVDYWLRCLSMLIIAGGIGFARAYPMLQDSSEFANALAKRSGQEVDNDLLYNFVNTDNPITAPVFQQVFDPSIDLSWNTAYLGYIPLLLIGLGLLRPAYRRKMLFWLYLAIPFLLLRLGSMLTINGHQFESIALPKHLLESLLPSVFSAFYSTIYFHSGVLLPLAALSCYGLLTLLRAVKSSLRLPLIALLIVAVAFEYYSSLDQTIVSQEQLAFLDWLAAEEDRDSIRLINLPMGRVNAKLFDFYQTRNGYPHIEGIAGRTPDSAYDYIRGNLLLNTWSEDRSLRCGFDNQVEYINVLDALERDGFTHIIMHHQLWNSAEVMDSLRFATASWQNDFQSVYRIADIRASCPDHMPGHERSANLHGFISSATISPRTNESVLSLHPVALDERQFRFFSAEAEAWKSLNIASFDGASPPRIQSSNPAFASLEAIAANNSIIWLVYDPRRILPQSNDSFNRWYARHYQSCQHMSIDDNTIAERAISLDFPCELVDDQTSLHVRYQGGVVLAERLTESTPDHVSINLWWSDPGSGSYAFSVQTFDQTGVKFDQQQDQVISVNPVTVQTIDTTSFPPGQYSVRLIVYDFDTRQSQPGTNLSTGAEFQRELEIARFQVN